MPKVFGRWMVALDGKIKKLQGKIDRLSSENQELERRLRGLREAQRIDSRRVTDADPGRQHQQPGEQEG